MVNNKSLERPKTTSVGNFTYSSHDIALTRMLNQDRWRVD